MLLSVQLYSLFEPLSRVQCGEEPNFVDFTDYYNLGTPTETRGSRFNSHLRNSSYIQPLHNRNFLSLNLRLPQMHPASLVRLKWSEFQRWLEPRRRTMERQRDEITKEQDAKWLTTAAKSKAKRDAHDANRTFLVQALEEKHFGEARAEWQDRLERAGLSDDAWGDMTKAEQIAISRALGGDLDEELEEPMVVENLAVVKRAQLMPGPAPIISTASRISNLSTSSYTLVSPADLGSDDELYAAVSSYVVPTDDSEDEDTPIPVPIHNGKGWGHNTGWSPWSSNHSSLHGSPDRHDSKPLPDLGHATLPSTIKVEPKPTSKRPLDVDPKPVTKTRVRGPQYIGPQISDSDETSDEEADFEKFKMFTRITKIVEFHHAAALADIDLALSICNGRKTKQLGKLEEEVKVTQHERRMLELQATKESERKAVVFAERKKRRDKLRNRTILQDPIQDTDSANYDALFDPSTFQVDVDINGTFILRREDKPIREMENHVNGLSFESSRIPTAETPGARTLSVRRDTPSVAPGMQSGWKSTPAPSALSQVHGGYDEGSAATPIPQHTVDTSWSSTTANPLASNKDFHIPGGFPVELKATGTPATSAWGKKLSPESGLASVPLSKLPTVADVGSAKLTRADQTPIIATKDVNRILPPVEPERPGSPAASSSKKPNKKQRQANKKSGTAGLSLNKAEVEPPSLTPTIPSSSKRPGTTPYMDISKTSINGSSGAEEEELSSTPRPNVAHIMMKRQGLASGMAKGTPIVGTDDPGSTPRHSALRQLATMHDPNESMAEEESPWERMMKKKSDPESSKQEMSGNRTVRQKPKVLDHRSTNFSASTSSAAEEEESPWNRMTRLKAQGQAPQGSLSNTVQRGQGEEETPWQRTMRLKGQNQAPHGASIVPSHLQEDETPWERAMRLNGQPNQSSWGANSSSTKSMTVQDEPPWERSTNTTSQQSQHPDSRGFPVPPAMRQDRAFWHPGSIAPGANQRQMWNPGRTQSPHMEKSSSMATSNGRSQEPNRVRRMSDPVSPSPRLEFANLPDGDRQDFVPTSILKGAKSKQSSAKTKKVTIEEIPDEEGRPDEKLPSNSRYVLDIVEPKPSVPSHMYTRFFDFEAEDDDDTELSSFAPTPSTAPTSPPGEVPSLDDDELMEEIKNGGWENLLSGNASKPVQNTKHARWPADSLRNDSPSQAFDSAKLLSALQSVNSSPFVEEKVIVSSKPASSVPSAPDIKDNNDTAIKSTKEVKGKTKGKGADKRGKSGGRK